MNKISIFTLGCCILLAACGGGGGGGGGADEFTGTSLTYNGNRDEANLSVLNTPKIVSTLLLGPIVTSTTGETAVVPNAKPTGNSPLLSEVPSIRELQKQLVHDVLLKTDSRLSSRQTAQRAFDFTEPCIGSGSIRVTGDITSNGIGDIIFEYINCREGELMRDGLIRLRLENYSEPYQTPTLFRMDIDRIELTLPDLHIEFGGQMESHLNFEIDRVTLITNTLISRNLLTGETYMFRNLRSDLDYEISITNGGAYHETFSGQSFDFVHGYVQVQTLTPFYYRSTKEPYPIHGRFELIGSGGARVVVRTYAESYMMVEMDLNADHVLDPPIVIPWDELETADNLGDADGDGLHDGWELTHGLDSGNATDANGDIDGDGFTNYEEYIGGSKPDDPASLVKFTDIDIALSPIPSDLPIGKTQRMNLTLSNPNELPARDIELVATLPAGSTFLTYDSNGWSCERNVETLTCEPHIPMFGGRNQTFFVDIAMPLVTGLVEATFSVQTASFDPYPANNTVSTSISVEPLASVRKLDFKQETHDWILDRTRRLIYVSQPTPVAGVVSDIIIVVDLVSFAIIDRIPVAGGPRGLALSTDDSKLFVALNKSGRVAVIDTNTRSIIDQIDVEAELGDFRVHDVDSPRINELYVVADSTVSDPGLVKVDLAAGNAVSQIGGNQILKSEPKFTSQVASSLLHVLEAGKIHQFDLDQVGIPFIGESPAATPYTSSIVTDSSGSRLFTPEGNVIDTSGLAVAGSVGVGQPATSQDGSSILVSEDFDRIGQYDATSLSLAKNLFHDCQFGSPASGLVEAEAGQHWLLRNGNKKQLCQAKYDNSAPTTTDLSVTQNNTQPLKVGEQILLSSTAYNHGPATGQDVTLTVTLPADFEYIALSKPAEANCSLNLPVISCTQTELEVSDSLYMYVTVNLPASPGAFIHPAVVSSTTVDSYASNNSTSLNSYVGKEAVSEVLQISASINDLVFDAARNSVYISQPSLDGVRIVPLDSFLATTLVIVGNEPRGIDISADGNTLYVTMNDSGDLALIDLDSFVVSKINVAAATISNNLFDVLAADANSVFVTSLDDGTGNAGVARIDLLNGNAVTRVASNLDLGSEPLLAAGNSPQFVFIRESGNLKNRLYKLDISQASAPVIIDKPVFSNYSAPYSFNASADGMRLFLGSGNVVQSSDLSEVGETYSGNQALSLDDSALAVSTKFEKVRLFDTSSLNFSEHFFTTCHCSFGVGCSGFYNTSKIVEIQASTTYIMASNDRLCRVTRN